MVRKGRHLQQLGLVCHASLSKQPNTNKMFLVGV